MNVNRDRSQDLCQKLLAIHHRLRVAVLGADGGSVGLVVAQGEERGQLLSVVWRRVKDLEVKWR